MKIGHPKLSPGTKLKILSIGESDAWWHLREFIVGKTMIVKDNGCICYSNSDDIPHQILEKYGNDVGFIFYSVDYTIISYPHKPKTMKVEVSEKPVEHETKYPYIGIRKDDSDYTIVYFTSPDTGVCLATDYYGDKVGCNTDKWAEGKFTPFTGSITLSND